MTALPYVPAELEADDARELLERELAKPIYDESMSLFERFTQWLLGLFEDGSNISSGLSMTLTLVVIGVGILVISLIFWRTGPLRRNRRVAQGAEVFDSVESSAAQLRDLGAQAAAAGDYESAVLDNFRAVVKALQDRVIVSDHTGLTAQEAADQASKRFPDLRTELNLAARTFSDVLYGKRAGSVAQYEQIQNLDGRLRQAKPTRTDLEKVTA